MSDLWVVALAVAGFAGALAAIDGHVPPVPLVLAVGVVGAALAMRRPALLCVGVALLAASLAGRSLAGLDPPAPGPVRGEVTLVADPVPDGRGGVQAEVRLDGRRLSARAHTAAAAALDDRLTGERVTVLGRVAPPGPVERRLRYRHLAGRLQVESVVGWRPGHGVTRAANALRRTLADGAEVLPERQRSLLAGLTLGDDRHQPADLTDAFQGAGLTHLLAVSGSNLVFVMVVFAPLLARLRFGPRLALTLGVLAGFALLTRFEPSVLRATAMAAVAATGTALGRPASTLRTLGLGVTGILLVDPLLASALGFQLSAAGTAGIVVGAAALQRALPGPRWCAAPLSVTLAAQAAVAPLLVSAFGSVPLASVPANLLAVPAAGPVMVWGLTGGLAAGLVGGPVAAVLHLPTRALLAWIEAVALRASRWPLGDLGAPALVALAAGALALAAGHAIRAAATARAGPGGRTRTVPGPAPARVAPGPLPARPPAPRRDGVPPPLTWTAATPRPAPGGRPVDGSAAGGGPSVRRVGRASAPLRARPAAAVGGGLRVVGALVIGGVLVGTVGAATAAPSGFGPVPVAIGATAWRGGGAVVLVVDGRAVDRYVLPGLREAGVRRVDLVVLRTGARTARDAVATLRRRWPALAVLVPGGDDRGAEPDVEGASSPPSGTTITLGGLRLTVVSNAGGRLEVRVSEHSPPDGERERAGPKPGSRRAQPVPERGRRRRGGLPRDGPVGFGSGIVRTRYGDRCRRRGPAEAGPPGRAPAWSADPSRTPGGEGSPSFGARVAAPGNPVRSGGPVL